ncbi:MAG: FtsX-like permease family protein [Marinifilum sp.]|jgi:ABC-type lipoprotein release transport system permease subunit|nr:FtsX-like permease family protein [Marinifilum sp.]
MNKTKYIFKSLWYYRKQHLAVLLGTIVSTAVLTGALIVGDSVKNSLHELVNLRLGKVEYTMTMGDRFVRADLANEIAKDLDAIVEPVLQTGGIAVQPETNSRINNVQIYGVDASFNHISNAQIYDLKEDEACISSNLAERMNLQTGSSFLLRLKKASVIPANAPFVSDEDQHIALRLNVKAICDDSKLGRFSLKSNQVAPYNVFLSRQFLSEELDLGSVSNLILLAPKKSKEFDIEQLNKSLSSNWKLEDASLKIQKVEGKPQFELISDRVFIDAPITDVIDKITGNKEYVLSYFVNSLHAGKKETPYSFITSVDNNTNEINDDEIIINSWLAEDLKVKTGDTIQVKYYVIGALRQLVEESKDFRIKEILPIADSNWDRSLMPSFPGLTDAGSCSEWEAGVPVDFSKIRPKDEAYWKTYKGTPKAMISTNTAIKLWSNKYGNYTSVRFDKKDDLRTKIQEFVRPELLNVSFLDVRNEGKRAANNMVDFGGLFLSLSFFIIAAAILLTVLIYSLNLDNRNQETGILLGLGFSKAKITGIRVYESLTTIVLGGIFGVVLGIVYNKLILSALNSVWKDVVRTNMLSVHIDPATLFTGFVSGVLIATICIVLVTRKKVKKSVVSLIKNVDKEGFTGRKTSYSIWISLLSLLISIAIITYAFLSSLEQNAELLLSAGGLFLVSFSAFVHYYLNGVSVKYNTQTPGIGSLSVKNAARNVKRSLAIVVLLALGTFSVLITGANRKTFYNTENLNQSGTGGYEYWIEATLPVLHDLNMSEGQEKAGFWEGDLDKSVSFVQFRALEGDDASCLNLNQVSKPRVLGFTTHDFEQRKSFDFVKLLSGIDKENPWSALNMNFGDDVIPAIADQTVILWGLKKAVGDTLIYRNEYGKDVKLLLVGGLANSVFQGNILISDSLFQKNFPSVSGSRIILAECPQKDSLFMAKFENNLQDFGVRGTKTSEKMAAFYSVENTYLSMFMILGGLGVIIGTIGLGIVLLRNVWERRKELSVLRAIGYTESNIFKLLFSENLFLLLLGLVGGILSALIGILPSLFTNAFQMPYLYVLLLILAITISGLAWIYIPLKVIRRQNIIESLQSD